MQGKKLAKAVTFSALLRIKKRNQNLKGANPMKTKEELNALKEEVETLNKKLHELTEEELKQVSGGDGDMPCVTELTDELIKSGNFLVSNDGFWYKNEYYEVISAIGTMAHFISPTGKSLFIPYTNM